MLTIEELNRIYNSKKDLVAMRHHSNEAPKNCEYKRQVLICGGTGVTLQAVRRLWKCFMTRLQRTVLRVKLKL